eukprot:g3844.t1
MKRHSDRKAYFEQRQQNNFRWSGRVGDRDRAAAPPAATSAAAVDDAASQQQVGRDIDSSDPGTPSMPSPPPAGSPVLQQRTVRDVVRSAASDDDPVPVGEHHQGSFGVYMAHKIDKLRHQVDGAVRRLEGPDGSLFKGVVAHFNGHFPVPVATLRELLVSRGGVVEAYNTSRCTHMICEVLPAAKIRELRKMRHPPPVVRSAWIEDSVQARRKLPVAEYMVDGIFVQKGTLAASFAAAATPTKLPPQTSGSSRKERGLFPGDKITSSSSGSSSGSSSSKARASWGGAGKSQPSRLAATRPNSARVSSNGAGGRLATPSSDRLVDSRGGVGSGSVGRGTGGEGLRLRRGVEGTEAAFAVGKSSEVDGEEPVVSRSLLNVGGGGGGGSSGGSDGASAAPLSNQTKEQPATAEKRPGNGALALPAPHAHAGGSDGKRTLAGGKDGGGNRDPRRLKSKSGEGREDPTLPVPKNSATGDGGGSSGGAGGSGSGGGGGGGGGRNGSAAAGDPPPPFELPEMGAAGEGGRSTKDDPAFMKTFFRNSRLHFIGVGRAHAVKVVNAGLAARNLPGAAQPVFGGGLGRGESRVILHVDMDCFFVSVLVKNRPELRDKPVAVAHNASNAKGAGSSEISSCNYPARAFGLRAGMFMMQAKKLCPELIVLRYDFEAYTETSEKMYRVFLRYAPVVMAVSCDEAFLELAEGTDPMEAATRIRQSIFDETGCSASAGASNNMLLARMATKEAKPNGQFWLPPEMAMHHMGPLPVQDLPGVGWKLRQRLNEEGLNVCSDLWQLSLSHMQKGLGLGEKTGRALWEACRGIDKRPVQAPPERKSIGAEVNYGVRFDTHAQADGFLSELAVELSRRMATEGVLGRALTLKIMKQRDGVGLPRKYLGHGICDARSKLLNLRRATADAGLLKSHALQLLREAKVPPSKIRGIGLQMTRLCPSTSAGGVGGGDGVVVEADGGSFGALHGWLIKPGGEDGVGDSSTKSAASSALTKPGGNAAVGERGSPSSVREGGTEEDGAPSLPLSSSSSSPTVLKGRGGSLGPCARSLSSPTVNGNVGKTVTESEDEMAVSREQRALAAESAAASGGDHRSNKRPRGGEKDGEAAPSNARPSPRRPSDPHSVGSVASTTSPSAAGVVARPATADEAGAGAAKERSPNDIPDSARKRKVAWTDRLNRAEAADYLPSSTTPTGDGTTPSRKTEHKQRDGRRADPSRDWAGSGPSTSPTARRPINGALPDSPEFLSPPTPTERVMATPSTGATASPSMSQITFSQIDKSVLGALPPELRQEVICQVEARKRLRQAGNNSSYASVPSVSQGSPSAARPGGGHGNFAAGGGSGSSGGGGSRGAGRDVGGSSSAIDAAVGGRPGAAVAGGERATEAVREGFDLMARGGPAKVQQVSLDSLWTLKKLREEGDDEPGVESSVFDRGSLRALPLGLGLHYASLTENQRAQIARRYAQQTPPMIHSAQAESRARDPASPAAAAAAALDDHPHQPHSPPAAVSGADDGGEGGHSYHSPPSNLPPPPVHSLLSPPEVLDVSPAAREGAERTPPPRGEEPPPVSSPRSAELHLLSLSQVDRDVLDCLPSEVRDEVLRAISVNTGGGGGAGGTGSRVAAAGEVVVGRSNHDGRGDRAEEGQAREADDGDAGLVDEEEVVDVCSPSVPSQPSSHRGERARPSEGQGRVGGGRRLFEMESAATLRGALRKWIGGAVRYPSQWHLELLYRYLEELVEGGRLDETAALLRCLGRLSSKADQQGGSQGPSGGSPGDDKRGAGWVTGYHAVLAAVQELVRKQTGGATLALIL